MTLADVLDDLGIFRTCGAVDDIILINPLDRLVRRQVDDTEIVDIGKFVGLCQRRTGHAGQFAVEAEIVLERNRRQGLVFRLDVDLFLGLDGLVQAF